MLTDKDQREKLALDSAAQASGPKRIIADVTPELAKPSEPESVAPSNPTGESQNKLPRIEPDSAVGPPRPVPPTALLGAEAQKMIPA